MAYLLDSNVLIQAKDFHYGFDLCPGFWDWLLQENANGVVYSIEKVSNVDFQQHGTLLFQEDSPLAPSIA